MTLTQQMKTLAATRREEVIEALTVTARERAHEVGLDQAIRSAVETAYHVGRLAVALEVAQRTIDHQLKKVDGVLQ